MEIIHVNTMATKPIYSFDDEQVNLGEFCCFCLFEEECFFFVEEELHRLPRQPGSSSQYLLQSVYDHGQKQDIQLISTIFSLLFLFIVQ